MRHLGRFAGFYAYYLKLRSSLNGQKVIVTNPALQDNI